MPNINDNVDQQQQLNNAQSVINDGQQGNVAQPQTPFDMLVAYAEKDSAKQEVSLKSLKKSEIDKIMSAFNKCKDVANSYYKSTIQPKLKERERSYLASEEYYRKLFPALSETSNFCSRDIKTTVKWMIPSLCEPFLGGDDPVDIKGVNANDDDKATKIQQLLKYQLQRKNSYPTFIDAVWTDAIKLNHAVAKVYWDRKEDRERYKIMISTVNDFAIIAILNAEADKGSIEIISQESVKDAPDLSIIVFEKIIVKANHPVVQYMSPSELRYTPDSNTVQNAKFKAHRKIVNGDYLKRKEQEGVYENIDKAMEDFSGDTSYDTYETDKNKELNNIDSRLADNDTASKQFELYEGYLQVDFNNDGIYEDLIVHAIGDVPIRVVTNDIGISPFFATGAEVSPNTAFNENESFTDNLIQQQDLKTAVFRQIITNVAKNNRPRTFLNMKSNIDIDAMIDGDEFVFTDGPPRESVYEGSQLPISPLSMSVIEYAQNEIEAQSGSTRYNQGLDSNSLNKTATGITAIMGSAEKRMKHMARMFAENFLIPLFKYLILLNQKYLDQEQIFRLADENIVIDKSELDIDYDLIINVGLGAGTREAQIQYLMILINQIYPQLQAAGLVTPESWYEIVKDLLEKMGIRNVSNYLLDPSSKEAKALQQQQQQAQQQAKEEEMQLLQAKAELELSKARQPRITVNFDDLPPAAQVQYLKSQGINIEINDVLSKELMEYVKKNKGTGVSAPQNLFPGRNSMSERR